MATSEGEGKRLEASHVFIGGKRHRLGLHTVGSKRGADWRLAQNDEIDHLLIEEVNAVASFVQPVFQEKDEVSCVMRRKRGNKFGQFYARISPPQVNCFGTLNHCKLWDYVQSISSSAESKEGSLDSTKLLVAPFSAFCQICPSIDNLTDGKAVPLTTSTTFNSSSTTTYQDPSISAGRPTDVNSSCVTSEQIDWCTLVARRSVPVPTDCTFDPNNFTCPAESVFTTNTLMIPDPDLSSPYHLLYWLSQDVMLQFEKLLKLFSFPTEESIKRIILNNGFICAQLGYSPRLLIIATNYVMRGYLGRFVLQLDDHFLRRKLGWTRKMVLEYQMHQKIQSIVLTDQQMEEAYNQRHLKAVLRASMRRDRKDEAHVETMDAVQKKPSHCITEDSRGSCNARVDMSMKRVDL